VAFPPEIDNLRKRNDADGTFAVAEVRCDLKRYSPCLRHAVFHRRAQASTHTSTVNFGLNQSMRAMLEAAILLHHATWTEWSDGARERRNQFAGRKDMGL